jgi:hypothetical protein
MKRKKGEVGRFGDEKVCLKIRRRRRSRRRHRIEQQMRPSFVHCVAYSESREGSNQWAVAMV